MSDNHNPICNMRFEHIEEKIRDLKELLHEQKDLMKDITDIVDEVSDENEEIGKIVKDLKDKEEKLEKVVSELNQTAKTLGTMAKFAKPLIFAVLAAALSSIPGGMEIIKLLAGLF